MPLQSAHGSTPANVAGSAPIDEWLGGVAPVAALAARRTASSAAVAAPLSAGSAPVPAVHPRWAGNLVGFLSRARVTTLWPNRRADAARLSSVIDGGAEKSAARLIPLPGPLVAVGHDLLRSDSICEAVATDSDR